MGGLLALRWCLFSTSQLFQKKFHLLRFVANIQMIGRKIIILSQPLLVILEMGWRNLTAYKNSYVILHNGVWNWSHL
jgi:hypothetical protein